MARSSRGRPAGSDPQLDREVEEGLALLERAVVQTVKNQVIVDVLTSDGSVRPEQWTAAASTAMGRIAEQSADVAERLRRDLAAARSFRPASHAHDFRRRDRHNLRRRLAVAEEVQARLQAAAIDRATLLRIVQDARSDAWHEIDRAAADAGLQAAAASADHDLLEARVAVLRPLDPTA